MSNHFGASGIDDDIENFRLNEYTVFCWLCQNLRKSNLLRSLDGILQLAVSDGYSFNLAQHRLRSVLLL